MCLIFQWLEVAAAAHPHLWHCFLGAVVGVQSVDTWSCWMVFESIFAFVQKTSFVGQPKL